ncbi:tyrosine--tRNA ligase, partial [bacterium]|nr:tyrosine--tRNA ligase [bacterium]
EKAFSKGGVPDDIQIIKSSAGSIIRDVLVKEGVVSSNSDWKRLVDGKAISHADTGEVIEDAFIKVEKEIVLRVGKKRFVKIEI